MKIVKNGEGKYRIKRDNGEFITETKVKDLYLFSYVYESPKEWDTYEEVKKYFDIWNKKNVWKEVEK